MVKLIEVDPDEIDNTRVLRRGRVSYPIIKTFLESNKYVVMLDRTGIQQSMQTLTSCLNGYIRHHNVPVKIFTRQGQLYMMRLDIDKEGNKIEDWSQKMLDDQVQARMPVEEINPEVVSRRFDEEIDRTTK